MAKYKITLNKDRCISCHACEVHCKVKNRVPTGISLNRILVGEITEKDGRPHITNRYQPCFQCNDPKCVPVCPTEAMTIRETDGLVYIREELCIGCKECITACPWSVPVFNEATDKAIKCDLCMDRIDAGLEPACVTGCTAKALSLTLNKSWAKRHGGETAVNE